MSAGGAQVLHSRSPVRPCPPTGSTARSRHGILKPEERTGASRSAQAVQRHRYGEPGTYGKYGWLPVTFLPGSVIWASSTAGSIIGPQLLYQAIGAPNLRVYVQGQDDSGHAALAN